MAFLPPTAAASFRAPAYLASSSRTRSVLPTAVRAAAGSSDSNATSPHPILSSLRLAASAAVLLAATSSPAIACTPSPIPPPAALTATVSPEDPIPEDSHPFEKLIVETAALFRFGDAEAARARLSAVAISGSSERCARLLAAQALFVDGEVEAAISAFEELAQEDPSDYRPLFCQGVLYIVLGRGAESNSMLERCRELAGDVFGPDLATLASPTDATVVNAESEADKANAEMLNV